jgi:tetratricopeptide (TPR) repeat protein
VLFFSGYGIQTGKQSYLIPVDAQIWTEGEVKRDGISVESILSAMEAAGASVKVVIVDAARRNPFERRFRGFSGGLASLNAPAGTLAIYSAAPDKLASESSDGGSVFVSELLKQVRTQSLSAEDMFNRTRVEVSRASRNEQVPSVSSSLTETFYFSGAPSRPSPSAEPRPAPPEPRPSASLGPPATTPVEKPKSPPAVAKKEPAPAEPASSPEEYNKRGRTYAVNGDYASADADFSEAIRRNSKYAEAFNNRCWTRAVMGQAEEAVADCDQAIRLRVDYADAFDSRGLAHLQLGKFDRAIADFDAALRLRPKMASSLYGRGVAELKKGQASAGNADIAEAKRIDPGVVQEYEHYGVE